MAVQVKTRQVYPKVDPLILDKGEGLNLEKFGTKVFVPSLFCDLKYFLSFFLRKPLCKGDVRAVTVAL